MFPLYKQKSPFLNSISLDGVTLAPIMKFSPPNPCAWKLGTQAAAEDIPIALLVFWAPNLEYLQMPSNSSTSHYAYSRNIDETSEIILSAQTMQNLLGCY